MRRLAPPGVESPNRRCSMPDRATRHRWPVLIALLVLSPFGCTGATGSVAPGAAGTTGSGAAGTGTAGTGVAGTGAAGTGAAGSGSAGTGAAVCGSATAPKGVTNGTIQVNGASRAYVLSIPSGY